MKTIILNYEIHYHDALRERVDNGNLTIQLNDKTCLLSYPHLNSDPIEGFNQMFREKLGALYPTYKATPATDESLKRTGTTVDPASNSLSANSPDTILALLLTANHVIPSSDLDAALKMYRPLLQHRAWIKQQLLTVITKFKEHTYLSDTLNTLLSNLIIIFKKEYTPVHTRFQELATHIQKAKLQANTAYKNQSTVFRGWKSQCDFAHELDMVLDELNDPTGSANDVSAVNSNDVTAFIQLLQQTQTVVAHIEECFAL